VRARDWRLASKIVFTSHIGAEILADAYAASLTNIVVIGRVAIITGGSNRGFDHSSALAQNADDWHVADWSLLAGDTGAEDVLPRQELELVHTSPAVEDSDLNMERV
jgi:hypothetical protein